MLVASSHRTSSKLDATLLISTLQGQKVGTIGNGRKAGSKRLFKQRPWEFDFLDAHDEPRFRLRRLPGSQKTTAEVYERGDAPGDANWRKMGQIAVDGTDPWDFEYRVSYTLFEVETDGLCREPFARTVSHALTDQFCFQHNNQLVASQQEIPL